jgi:ubiquitin C-terminal hydrolase
MTKLVNLQKLTILLSSKQIESGYRTGITNSGNTCYLNSVLQMLASIPQLSTHYLSNTFSNHLQTNSPLGSNGQLSLQYSHLLKALLCSSPSSPPIQAHHLKHTLSQIATQFSNQDQQDSQEAMIYLLDILHEDSQLNHSPISSLLSGQFLN